MPAIVVQSSRDAQMPGKVPLADERGQDCLWQQRRVAIGRMLRIHEIPNQRLGHDGIGNPESGEQDLVEAAEVDHAIAVHVLQGRQRPALVTVVAVIVILDDMRILRLGPIQQLVAARNTC